MVKHNLGIGGSNAPTANITDWLITDTAFVSMHDASGRRNEGDQNVLLYRSIWKLFRVQAL